MSSSDAQRILDVIRQAISQETRGQSKVEYSYGEFVESASGYLASAYLNGNGETLSEEFRMLGHLHANVGDYGIFAVDHGTGARYVVEVLPNSLYSKIAIDQSNGIIYTGDGISPPSNAFDPTATGGIVWEDTDMVFEDNEGADELVWE